MTTTTRKTTRKGNSGTIEGQAGTPESEWAKKGEVWGPSVRVDSPEGDTHE